jgi:hypothetical protein
MEEEDLPLFQEWMNNLEFRGEFLSPTQRSKAELEKLEGSPFESKNFIIEKKDGTKIDYTVPFKSYLGRGERAR